MDITCLLHFSALGSSLHSDARKGLRSCQTENHTQQIQLSPDTQHFTQALLPINAKLCHKLQGLLLPRIFSKWRTIMIYSPDKLNYHRLIKTYLNPLYPNQNLSPVVFFFSKHPIILSNTTNVPFRTVSPFSACITSLRLSFSQLLLLKNVIFFSLYRVPSSQPSSHSLLTKTNTSSCF